MKVNLYLLKDLLDANNKIELAKCIRSIHPADCADFIEDIDSFDRRRLVDIVPEVISVDVLIELDCGVRSEILDLLYDKHLKKLLKNSDNEEILKLFDGIREDLQANLYELLGDTEKSTIRHMLSYPDKSIGRIASQAFIAVPEYWTVSDVKRYLEEEKNIPEFFSEVFVVNPKHNPIGVVPLSRLFRSPSSEKIDSICEKEIISVLATEDQENAAIVFKQYSVDVAPVVDKVGRIIGVLRSRDVVEIVDEEGGEDLLGLEGVVESSIHAPIIAACSARLRWLLVTLVNAVVSSFVVASFQETILKKVILAALMPAVASLGGNVGMQSVAVLVRSLATNSKRPENIVKTVRREVIIGGLNGLVLGLILSAALSVILGSVSIGLILVFSLVLTMAWSGFVGSMIPVLIRRFGHDPAIGAGPLLTTVSDICGFFIFLMMAKLFLS